MDPHYSPDSDHQLLLQGLRDGHEVACRVIADWLRWTVIRPQFHIPRDEVDDLVQESLTRLLDLVADPEFRIHTSLKALVRQVAMARCVDWIRRRRMLVELSPTLVGENADPLERIARQEDLGRIHEALLGLKTLCRDLIRWHFTEEMTYPAIAEKTGRNANTLRVHMFKCLEALRTRLDS
jgi:RNA polymerase sigma factor (sigma-70 family)